MYLTIRESIGGAQQQNLVTLNLSLPNLLVMRSPSEIRKMGRKGQRQRRAVMPLLRSGGRKGLKLHSKLVLGLLFFLSWASQAKPTPPGFLGTT